MHGAGVQHALLSNGHMFCVGPLLEPAEWSPRHVDMSVELRRAGRDVLNMLPWCELFPFLGPECGWEKGREGGRAEWGFNEEERTEPRGPGAGLGNLPPLVFPSSPNPRLLPEDGRMRLRLRGCSLGARLVTHEGQGLGGCAG